jgi:hypothetical protein
MWLARVHILMQRLSIVSSGDVSFWDVGLMQMHTGAQSLEDVGKDRTEEGIEGRVESS